MFAIQPPEYFPGLAYCALMAHVDRFYVAECFQYSRQSYQNRTRLRTPDGIQWISVPLIGGQFGQSIREMRIDYSQNWQKKHLKALKFNYASTPFYEHYYPDLVTVMSHQPETLGELSMSCLELIHSQLDLSCSLELTEISAEEVENAISTDISGAMKNPHESRLIHSIDEARIDQIDGDVRIMSYEHPTYRQNFSGFEPGLSILDLLFTHGPDAQLILRSGIIHIGTSKFRKE